MPVNFDTELNTYLDKLIKNTDKLDIEKDTLSFFKWLNEQRQGLNYTIKNKADDDTGLSLSIPLPISLLTYAMDVLSLSELEAMNTPYQKLVTLYQIHLANKGCIELIDAEKEKKTIDINKMTNEEFYKMFPEAKPKE